MKKKTENLFINAILLAVTMMAMKSIGIVFKVYISNEVGAEGMGLYKLIGTVSMVAITFATSGISAAVTRIVSEEASKKAYNNIKYVTFKACTICGILGLIASLVLFIFAENIAFIFLKDTRVVLSLKIIAVSIPFISISACLKGYFFAVRDIFIPITTQISEKFIQIAVVVALLDIAVSKGLEYGCAVLVLGSVISDVLSFFYVFIAYKLDNRQTKYLSGVVENSRDLHKRIFKIATPVATSSYVMSIFGSVEMILIPSSLIKYGMTSTEAISILGGVIGMVIPIIMFPATLLMSFGRVLMPEISRAKVIGNKERVNSVITRSIGLTSIIGIISFFIFFIFYNQLSMSIYNNENIGMIFRMISFIIPFLYVDMIMGGILNGLNEQFKSLQYQVMESMLRLAGIYLLLPLKGVDGLIIVMCLTTLFSFTLSLARIIKVTDIKIDLINWLIKPCIFAIISIILGLELWGISLKNTLSIGMNTTVVITCVLLIYFMLLKVFNCIKIRD